MQTLPVAPLALASGAVSVVALFAYFGPQPSAPRLPHLVIRQREGRRAGVARGAGLALGAVLVGVALVAGVAGDAAPARNLAPGLLVSVGWPLAVLVAMIAGRAAPAPAVSPAASVHPAVVSALVVVWYLVVQPDRLRPRVVVGFAVVYALVAAAGCLAVGARAWPQRGDAVGLLLGWLGRLRRGGLATWQPPAGAAAVLGVLAGGFLFGLWRNADPWLWLVGRYPGAGLASAVVAVGGTAGLLVLSERRAGRRRHNGTVTAASVPLVGGLALAHAVDRGLLTAVQLLPRALADPLGRGWDVAGLASTGATPVEPVTRLAIELVLICAGGVAAAHVIRTRGGAQRVNAPAVCAVAVIVAAGLLAVAHQSVRILP